MNDRSYYIEQTKKVHYYKFKLAEPDEENIDVMYLSLRGELQHYNFELSKEDYEIIDFPNKVEEITKEEFTKNANFKNVVAFNQLQYNLLLSYPDDILKDFQKQTKQKSDKREKRNKKYER